MGEASAAQPKGEWLGYEVTRHRVTHDGSEGYLLSCDAKWLVPFANDNIPKTNVGDMIGVNKLPRVWIPRVPLLEIRARSYVMLYVFPQTGIDGVLQNIMVVRMTDDNSLLWCTGGR